MTPKQREVLRQIKHTCDPWWGCRAEPGKRMDGRRVSGRRQTLFSLERAGLITLADNWSSAQITDAGREALR